MSIFNGNKKYLALGACAGVLVLAGGLCAILLSGKDGQLAQAIPQEGQAAPPAATTMAEQKFVVGTPEVDLVAEQQKREIQAIVNRTDMLPGTIIYGVDVSNMSRDKARAAVEEKLANDPPAVNLFLSDGTNVYPASGDSIEKLATAEVIAEEEEDDDAIDPELRAAEAAAAAQAEEDEDPTVAADNQPVGIRLSFDVETAVDQAFSLLRDASVPYADLMAQVKEIAAGKEIAPAPVYDAESVTQFVSYLANLMDTPAVNATIGLTNNVITYTDEIMGHGVDQEALTESILAADPLSGSTIDIPMHDLEAAVTRQMLEGKYVRRGQYTTSFSSSTSNRKYNIRFGAEKINGTILKPGEVFSTNETLGTRTRKNGWKMAGAYEGGEVVQQAGGGVCQLSSTLYNAVIYADLEIVKRQNHSMTVAYIDPGRDATINSVGNIIDFQFRNNTSSDIIIVAYTEGNKKLHMEIYGVPFETDAYDEIKIRTKRTKTTPATTVETKDNTKPVSYQVTTYNGKAGSTWQTYKDYYKNGTRVNTESLGTSTYKMFPKQVTVGTLPEETPPPNTGGSGNGGDSGSTTGGDSGSTTGGDSGSTTGDDSGSTTGGESGSASTGGNTGNDPGSGSGSGSSGNGGDPGSGSGSSGSGDDSGSSSGSSGSGGESGSSSSSSGSGGDSGSSSGSSGSGGDSGSSSGSSGSGGDSGSSSGSSSSGGDSGSGDSGSDGN